MDIEKLKVIADENRLAIVTLLAGGERCVCEVASELGLSDALVSHHVRRLSDAGIVRVRRVGRWRHCRLDDEVLQAMAEEFAQLSKAAREAAAVPGECSSCAPPRSIEETS